MSFDQLPLNENIQKAIKACGYTTPTPIQAKSIPEILAKKDVVACAQTGTGKTAAFVLPALQRLTEGEPTKKTRILILTPTRELASQITAAANLYGKFLKFNIVSLVGGMPYHNQLKDLARGADIIVATPGRLIDHIESKRLDLSSVEMLVLDEADRMLDMGFIDDVQFISKLTPATRQTLMFSATVDKELANIVRHLLKNPVKIDLSNEKLSAPLITQEMYKATGTAHKTRLLKHFLKNENVFKAIIFSATKINADKIADDLCNDGFSAAALHGDLRQNVRNRTIDQLRRGKLQFLVATDVASRGIDISDITHVFNYDLPRFCEDYVHRIGRTGRAGKTGIAISFVSPIDAKHLQRIERFTGQRIKVMTTVDLPPAAKGAEGYGEDRSEFKKERSFSGERRERPSFGDDSRPARRFSSSRDDAPSSDRGFRSERPRSTGNDDYAPKKRFSSSRDGAPSSDRGFRSERPRPAGGDDYSAKKRFSSSRDDAPSSDLGNRSERPRSTGSDDFASKKRFSSSRDGAPSSDRGFRSERPRSTGSDDFAPKKRFSSSRDGGFRSERPRSTGSDDYAPKKRFSSSRDGAPSSDRGNRSERPRSTGSDDYAPKKRFSSSRDGAPSSDRGFRSERPRSASSDDYAPKKRFSSSSRDSAPSSDRGFRSERPRSASSDDYAPKKRFSSSGRDSAPSSDRGFRSERPRSASSDDYAPKKRFSSSRDGAPSSDRGSRFSKDRSDAAPKKKFSSAVSGGRVTGERKERTIATDVPSFVEKAFSSH